MKTLFWGRHTQRCRQSLVLHESAMWALCSHRGTKRKSFCYPKAEDSCPPWSSLFPMPNGLSLPHTIRRISSDPVPAEPPRPSLRWHIKATLQSRKLKTPLIHQSLYTLSLPHTPISSWRVSNNSQGGKKERNEWGRVGDLWLLNRNGENEIKWCRIQMEITLIVATIRVCESH